MKRHWITGFAIGSVGIALPALAIQSQPPGLIAQQQTLTSAELYRLQNRAQLLLYGQSPRAARLSDRLVPRDALQTSASSIAQLLFNEGSIARVDQNSTFRFTSGLRRFQLPNRIAFNETIFQLDAGAALIISPPNSVGTQIQTPEGSINIAPGPVTAMRPVLTALALPVGVAQDTGDLLPPPDRSNVVMVVHDSNSGVTQVFALTAGSTVSDRSGANSVELQGGQTVGIARGQLGEVQEFDLQAFYASVPLAAGLAPDQASVIAQDPAAVQASIEAVRPALESAIRSQNRRINTFAGSFLRDALGSIDRDYNGQRGVASSVILEPQVTPGNFEVQEYNDDTGFAVFTDGAGNQTNLVVDFSDRSIRIVGPDGQLNGGRSNNANLSGNNAVGTVIFENGRATRIEVFGVDGDRPDAGEVYPGTLTTGTAPDR